MTPTASSDATAAKSEQDLVLEDLKKEVSQLLSDHVDDEATFEKMYQYLRLRKADYYYRGIQYIAPQLSLITGQIDYTPSGTPAAGFGQDGLQQRGQLDYNIDIIQTYGRKFIATLGQRPFYNLKATPNDPQSDMDRRAAREADKAYYLLRSWWNVKQKNLELAYHAWKSGTTFPYTRFVADANKYGIAEEPVIDVDRVVVEPEGFACPQCGTKSPELETIQIPGEDGAILDFTHCPACKKPLGRESYVPPVEASVPIDTGEVERYAQGRVELHFLNGFYVTVPFYGQNLQDVPFLVWECEEHIGRMMALYPKLRDKYRDGNLNVETGTSAVDQMGILSRASAASQTGMPRPQSKDRVLYRRTWIRPFMYEMVKDEAKRKTLKDKFPDGLKIVRVEKEVVDLANEKLDDYFATMQPEVGDYIFRDGICWGILQHQDAINDIWNQLVEILERTNTVTFVDPDYIDVDEWASRPTLPMEIIAAKPGAGGNLDNAFKTMQSPKFPDQAPQMIGTLKAAVESQTGVLPNLFGAGAPTQTAEQSRNELNQALMQLGTTGEFMVGAWIGAFTNGVWELARNAPKNLKVPSGQGGPGGETIDLEVLQSGEWHFEGEMGIPRSFAERKDELKALINGQGPIAQMIATMFGVTSPVNISALRDFLDIPDLKNPTEEMRNAIQDMIDDLSAGEPIQQVGPDGVPQMLPSKPIDFGIYDPAMFVEVARFWAVGPGRKLQDTPGYQNVMAAMMQAKQAMMPPPMVGPDGQPLPPPDGAPAPPPPDGPPPPVNNKQTPDGTELPPVGGPGPMGPQ